MTRISIRHRTTYRYRRPVGLGPHRLMLRPREKSRPEAALERDRDVAGCHARLGAGRLRQRRLHHDFRRAGGGARHRLHQRTRARRRRLARLRHRRRRHLLSLPLFGRGLDRSRAAPLAPVSGSRGTARGMGAGFRRGQSDRHAVAPQGSQRRHLGRRVLRGARGRGRAVAGRDARPRRGLVPRLSRRSSPRRRAASVSARGSSRATCTTRTSTSWARRAADRPTPGPRSMCPAPAGSPSTRPTGASAASNLIPVAVARDLRQAMPVTGGYVGSADASEGMWVEVNVATGGRRRA